MILFKILCVLSSIKIIENVPKQTQTVTRTYEPYEIEDNLQINDQVNDNFLDNESDTQSNDRKLKMYAALQTALQNLNAEQKFLFEDALNKYIKGNITENEIIDLLPEILLIDENSSELDKHEIDKYKSKTCPYMNNSNLIGVDDPECRTSRGHSDPIYESHVDRKAYETMMYTKYDDKYKSPTRTTMGPSTVSNITTLNSATVPFIVDLIRSFKNKKISNTTNIYNNWTTATTNVINESTTMPLREYKPDDHIIDVLTVLSVLAKLTEEYKPEDMLRAPRPTPKGTAPRCPYTISFGTSPRYKWNYEYFNRNRTGTLVTMCYVCGLEENQIPKSPLCEVAFDDVDWTYKKYSYTFIKYCRFDQYVTNYCVHASDKRSIWGRWTGGCSMRKIDISGIYTQRTCRNREWPTRGHHFASHRMARLEFVLNGVTDGCAISPGASLVPLSRGISLFARFIVCVCKGSLCNAAISYLTFSYLRLFVTSLAPITIIAMT